MTVQQNCLERGKDLHLVEGRAETREVFLFPSAEGEYCLVL